jgi:AcrR family transcriptional regulator
MSKNVVKENIISEAIHLFMKYGLRSVTMDDIAKHLAISKKTIYQHFKDKEEIIIQSSSVVFDIENKMMEEIENEAENAVEELYNLTLCLRERIKNTSTTALYDMKKYYQKAWIKYKNFKHDVIYNSVIKNLNRGMEEGLFRSDINPEVLAQLRIGEIELSFDKDFFQKDKFSLVEIHEQLFEHFTYGILSEKGLKLFETYKQKNNINEAI